MTLNSGAKFNVASVDRTENSGLWQSRIRDLLAQQSLLKTLAQRQTSSKQMDREGCGIMSNKEDANIRKYKYSYWKFKFPNVLNQKT